MSGIGGVLRHDGQRVVKRDLERVATALQRHGPDRSQVMLAGPIGLAHVLMRMTPEDSFDQQPLRGRSGASITADLRLDNRNDLLGRMGIMPHDAIVMSDAHLLLMAWERFGDAIWEKLRGPFAVAIWEPRRNVLTLARDHLGLNVIMWHQNERFFAFATMPCGLFSLPEIPRELDENKFADFLVLNHADSKTTIYRTIFRVPPAHIITVQVDGVVRQSRYWSANDIVPVRLRSAEDYAEGMRHVLDDAVRRQMRSSQTVGCFLSGGLDSSSVAVLAARALREKNQRLSAFTHVPRDGFNGPVPKGKYLSERPFVEAISRAAGNIDVTWVQNDDCDDFVDLERFFHVFEGPVRNPTNLGWMLAIPRIARAKGHRVLLGGFHGNHSISWEGWSQVIDHLLTGHLYKAHRQWLQFYRCSPYSHWDASYKLLIEPLIPSKLRYWAFRRHRKRLFPWQSYSAIRPGFAAEASVEERAAELGHDFLERLRRGERASGLTAIDYKGDWTTAQKAISGVELRDPTADIDVIAYCFGVPPDQYLAEGIDRSLIRRAMWNLLPSSVCCNRLMGMQSPDWYEKLQAKRAQFAAEIEQFATSPFITRTIDLDRLVRAVKNWPTEGWHKLAVIEEYNLALARGIAAARFLSWVESANRVSVSRDASTGL